MTVVFTHLQPLSTVVRHGAISSNHSEAWQWVSLWQQEVCVVMSRSHLHCAYKTHKQGTDQQNVHAVRLFLIFWWDCVVTSSELHVHHWVSDDGQESVGEGVSALLAMNSLKRVGQSRKIWAQLTNIMLYSLIICFNSPHLVQISRTDLFTLLIQIGFMSRLHVKKNTVAWPVL